MINPVNILTCIGILIVRTQMSATAKLAKKIFVGFLIFLDVIMTIIVRAFPAKYIVCKVWEP